MTVRLLATVQTELKDPSLLLSKLRQSVSDGNNNVERETGE